MNSNRNSIKKHESATYQGVVLKKSLGQNLLLDPNLNRKMAEFALLTEEDDVVEVGAGFGGLTEQIAARARRVLALEIDRSFMPFLEEKFAGNDKVILFRGDILNHEISDLVKEYLPGFSRLKMLSNLPYYITTPILMKFLESEVPFEIIVVMVQREVAERLAAKPHTKDYGILTLATQYHCKVAKMWDVSRKAFKPRPEVDSTIVRLTRTDDYTLPANEKKLLFHLIKAAFGQRRKMLRNSLLATPIPKEKREDIDSILSAAGIDPTRRAETLSLEEFVTLARAMM